VADAGPCVVHLRPAQRVECHILPGGDPDHLGTGDEHVADVVDHEDEVGHRRRVDGAPGAGSEDQAQLRYDAGGLDVAPEDLGVAGERYDALLDPRAARIVDSDEGHPVLEREIHHLADLLREHLPEGSAEDGRVVAEEQHVAAADLGKPGDHAVSRDLPLVQTEIGGAVGREGVQLGEGVAVDEALDPLPCRQAALAVLPLVALGVAVGGLVLALPELVDLEDIGIDRLRQTVVS